MLIHSVSNQINPFQATFQGYWQVNYTLMHLLLMSVIKRTQFPSFKFDFHLSSSCSSCGWHRHTYTMTDLSILSTSAFFSEDGRRWVSQAWTRPSEPKPVSWEWQWGTFNLVCFAPFVLSLLKSWSVYWALPAQGKSRSVGTVWASPAKG